MTIIRFYSIFGANIDVKCYTDINIVYCGMNITLKTYYVGSYEFEKEECWGRGGGRGFGGT